MHKIKYFTLAKCNNCFQYIGLVFWTPSHFTQRKTNNPTSVGWMEYSNIFEHRLIDWKKLGKLMLLPTQSQSHKNFCNNLSKLSYFWGVQLEKKLNLSSFWIRSNIVKSGNKSTLQSPDYNLLISCYGTANHLHILCKNALKLFALGSGINTLPSLKRFFLLIRINWIGQACWVGLAGRNVILTTKHYWSFNPTVAVPPP